MTQASDEKEKAVEYARLVGKWVLASTTTTPETVDKVTPKYGKWEMEYQRDANVMTKRTSIEASLCGMKVPQPKVDPNQNVYRLVEDPKRPGSMVLECKWTDKQSKHLPGRVYFRKRIIAMGNGRFEESFRGGLDWDCYPRFSERGFYRMELDHNNQIMTLRQRSSNRMVATFRKVEDLVPQKLQLKGVL